MLPLSHAKLFKFNQKYLHSIEFQVKISLLGDHSDVKIGHKAICMVTIIDDDGIYK